MILDDNYSIEIDTHNFTLKYEEQKEVIDKKTNLRKIVTSKAEWYYPTLNACLKRYFDETLREVKEIKDISTAIDNMYKVIDKIK